jgi:hypothetical protein
LHNKITYRQVLAISLIIVFLLQLFNKPFIVADYYVNTGKYAKNCENKYKPQLKCNGKCQMIKKIQEEAKKDVEKENRQPEKESGNIMSSKSFYAAAPSIYALETMQKKQFPAVNDQLLHRSFDIFHPPRA